jgi:drug/metabolite transporter (DMT)-like permease
MSAPAVSDHTTRSLDPLAATLVVVLCLAWGFNQVSIKLALPDFPPFIQGAVRSCLAALCVALWCRLRGIPLFARDGSLRAGLLAGGLFGIEFIFIFQGLVYTTATRTTLFLYLAPFFVVIGSRILLPNDHFSAKQWLGLALSFGGMIVAFGAPTPAIDPRQFIGDVMMVIGAALWAATTLTIKASRLNTVSPEKVLLYQLVVSAPIFVAAAVIKGEHFPIAPSVLGMAALAYQSLFVVSVTYVIWFALIAKYSANRLSAFTFLAPLFGVAAGHFVLNEPLTSAFVFAVGLVAIGLIFVNRAAR